MMAATAPNVKTAKELVEYQHAAFKNLKFCPSTISATEIEKRMAPVLKLIEQHPEALKLLNDVLAQGEIKVTFCDSKKMNCPASWEYTERKISLSDGITETGMLLNVLVFELCNANNAYLSKSHNKRCEMLILTQYLSLETIKDTNELLATLEKNAHDYAFICKENEYHTTIKHRELIRQGLEVYNWPKVIDEFYIPEKRDFNLYLHSGTIPSLHYHGLSHFQTYVKHFYTEIFEQSKVEMENQSAKLGVEQSMRATNQTAADTKLKPKFCKMRFERASQINIFADKALKNLESQASEFRAKKENNLLDWSWSLRCSRKKTPNSKDGIQIEVGVKPASCAIS